MRAAAVLLLISSAFGQTPQPLRDALLNYKKGIEIIHRMVKRLQDRKKPTSHCSERSSYTKDSR